MTFSEIVSPSEATTRDMGLAVGRRACPGLILLLSGPLGVGKTVFAGGVAQGLDIEGPVTSPTFTIVSEYSGRIPLYHIDLYRIDDQREFELLGLDEILYGSGVALVEWPERAGDSFSPEASHIDFELLADGSRRITYPAHLVAR